MKSEWKVSKIEDVCILVTDGSHFSPKSVDVGEPMVSVKDFTQYGFDFTNCRHISRDDYDRLQQAGCVPARNDVLIGKDGARFFEDVIIYKQEGRPALLSSIALLRANQELLLPEFLYYIAKNPQFRQNVRDNYGSGSAIPRVVLKDFRRMPISYPSIDEQEKIVGILGSIDTKIQINNDINKNLAA